MDLTSATKAQTHPNDKRQKKRRKKSPPPQLNLNLPPKSENDQSSRDISDPFVASESATQKEKKGPGESPDSREDPLIAAIRRYPTEKRIWRPLRGGGLIPANEVYGDGTRPEVTITGEGRLRRSWNHLASPYSQRIEPQEAEERYRITEKSLVQNGLSPTNPRLLRSAMKYMVHPRETIDNLLTRAMSQKWDMTEMVVKDSPVNQ